MGRLSRSLIVVFAIALLVAALAASWGGVRRIEAQAGPTSADAAPLVLIGQKPRLQEFFAGNTATFTVGITNTGTVALQTVAIVNATTPACGRTNVGPLAPGQSTSYSCTRTGVNESFMNELEAVGTTEGGVSDNHVANAYVNVLNPDLRITKREEFQTVRPGATAFYSVVVFNSSPDIIMTHVTVDDSADACDFDPLVPVNIAPKGSINYVCHQANIQAPVTSVVTAQATDPTNGDIYLATNAAWVDILDLTASLTPQPNVVSEPGGSVTFNVTLVNTGSVPVTLAGLTTNQFGNILDAGNGNLKPGQNTCLPQPTLPTIQPYGGSYSCSFVATVSGQPSDFSVILTATAKDGGNQTATATTNATVQIANVAASINVSATADPPFIHPPSQLVTYSVRVDNVSEADTVTITQMRDEFLGGLDGRGSCDVPAVVEPGRSYQCAFSAVVSGSVGQQKSRTITVTARDDDLNPGTVTDSARITVNITDLPTQYAYMPAAIESSRIGDKCSTAFPLALNKQYYFFPPAQKAQHVFRFTLTRSGSLSVQLNNFVPREGQLVVWTGNCGSLELIGHNPDSVLNRTVDLGTRPPGQYIIQIFNDGPTNTTDLYRLRVIFD